MIYSKFLPCIDDILGLVSPMIFIAFNKFSAAQEYSARLDDGDARSFRFRPEKENISLWRADQ